MGVIRRRKKKKKITEKSELSPDIDSGYFNGPESSSELTSETELFTDDEVKESVSKEKVISDVLIQQCSDPMLDFQFGDVQEILEELSRTKSQAKTEPEEIQQVAEKETEDIHQVAEIQQETEEIKTDERNANIYPEEKEVSSELLSSEHCKEDVIREAETAGELVVQDTVHDAAECLKNKNNNFQTEDIPSKVKNNK